MRHVSAGEIDRLLAFPDLIAAIESAFRGNIAVPVRHHHEIERAGAATATALLMPAWTRGHGPGFLGIKVVSVFPDNGALGLPAVNGTYLLMSGDTGLPLATMDGARLTAWRTAAASALAARFLAVPEASRMAMMGAGALAAGLIRAHACVRPIRHVTIWNRTRGRAEALAATLADLPLDITVTDDPAEAVAAADIVSCATLSRDPLVRGRWLKPGAHLDLVGAYNPGMRESDDECVRIARLFVDTESGALKEAGDIVQPLADGVIDRSRVEGDLFALCRGTLRVERRSDEITLFKSVGTAIEDLAAAMLVWRKLAG
jgi:ornithine cyclodeaminase